MIKYIRYFCCRIHQIIARFAYMYVASRAFGLMIRYPDETFTELENKLWKIHIKDCREVCGIGEDRNER